MYDVIIVGGGAAGSVAAYNLASKGLKVLIIDKAKFPRYKVCGGGIPYKANDLLQAILSSSHHHISSSSVFNFLFSCKYKNIYKRHSNKILIQCFMREELDNLLLENAINAGAVFIESQKVKEVTDLNHKITVKTLKTSQVSKTCDVYTSRFLIGADGSNSIVAKSLNLMQQNVSFAYAIESEIYVHDKTLENYNNTVGLDWGTLTNGYGWIFPKKDHLSVGVGAPATLAKHVKPYYQNLLQRLDITVKETKSIHAHLIPFRKCNNKIYSHSAVLVGDAAGLTDPLTGEGIYYALKSGSIAASVIIDLLHNKINDLSVYQNKINEEIMEELNAALPIQYIFNLAPLYFHKLLRDNDRLWNAFCRILRGELSYTVVKSKLPASDLYWKPLVSVTRFINKLEVRS